MRHLSTREREERDYVQERRADEWHDRFWDEHGETLIRRTRRIAREDAAKREEEARDDV